MIVDGKRIKALGDTIKIHAGSTVRIESAQERAFTISLTTGTQTVLVSQKPIFEYTTLIRDVLGKKSACTPEAECSFTLTLDLTPKHENGEQSLKFTLEVPTETGTDGIYYKNALVQSNAEIPLGEPLHIEGFEDSEFAELRIGGGKWHLDIKDRWVLIPNDKISPGPATISLCAHTEDSDKVCVPVKTVTIDLVVPKPVFVRYTHLSPRGVLRDPLANARGIARTGAIFVWTEADTESTLSMTSRTVTEPAPIPNNDCWFAKNESKNTRWMARHLRTRKQLEAKFGDKPHPEHLTCKQYHLRYSAGFIATENFEEITFLDLPDVDMTLEKRNVASLYWSMGGTIPFWIPVGLVGTNFQPISAGRGIPIAALPAGLAFGVKFMLGQKFFLGVSAFGNWSIQPRTGGSTSALPYPGKGENITPSPTKGGGSGQFASGDTGNAITLKAFAAGGLVDIGGFFVVGGAAAVDFTGRQPSVAPIFVLGAGQRFLAFLNGQRQSARDSEANEAEE